jgi:capsular exopolysaccharide synthesis family protein
MELRDYLAIIRARWVIVTLSTLIALLVAGGYLLRATPVYQAKSTVFFSVAVSESSGDLSRGFTYAQRLASNYAQIATQSVVLDPVIEDLGLQMTSSQLASKVVARTPVGTVLIDILVTDTDPEQAAQIANTITYELTEAVGKLSPTANDSASAPVELVTVASAAIPTQPVSPRAKTSLLLALAIGLVTGSALALLRNALDPRLDRTELYQVTEAPVLGTLSVSHRSARRIGSGRSVGTPNPLEETILLRTNVEHLITQQSVQIAVVTSATEDGATSATVTLGTALAQNGMKVALVDADLRRPTLAARLGKDDSLGLSSVLNGSRPWRTAIQRLDSEGSALLSAGPSLDDPSRMLSADALRTLFKDMLGQYDLVLVKCPSVLQVAESLLLSRLADGVMIVADENSTDREALSAQVEALELAGTELLGIIFTT